jgi:hypothetical protein
MDEPDSVINESANPSGIQLNREEDMFNHKFLAEWPAASA